MSNRKAFKNFPNLFLYFALVYSENVIQQTGSKNAIEGQFFYQVSLQVLRGEKFEHICGGSIIRKDKIITAARCYYGKETYGIVAGSLNLYNETNAQRREVDKFVTYPNHPGNNEIAFHDIAIVTLKEDLKFNELVKPINLPKPEDCGSANPYVTMSGWGQHVWWLTIPSFQLHFSVVSMISNEECKASIGKVEYLDDTIICIRGRKKSSAVCSGDEGGPLSLSYTLVGVASFYFGWCGVTEDMASGYTNVCSHINWINNILDHLDNISSSDD